MSSVLEKKYKEPERPYSQRELTELEKKWKKTLRVGEYVVNHTDCHHSYLARVGGKKELEAIQSGNVGNCSVCWKIKRTPKKLKEKAKYLVNMYMSIPTDSSLSYDIVEIQMDFYTWLYNEFNPDKTQTI
jgi:hypothetical protein